MSATAEFASIPRLGSVVIATLNAARDGTGTIGTVFTAAGAKGARIEKVKIKARATTTAGMVRLFVYDGATYSLLAEVPVSAVVPSSTVASFEAVLSLDAGSLDFPLVLPTGHSLRASTEKAESFQVLAFAGEL